MTVEKLIGELNAVWDRFTTQATRAELEDAVAALGEWCDDATATVEEDDGSPAPLDDADGWWDEDGEDEDAEFDSELE